MITRSWYLFDAESLLTNLPIEGAVQAALRKLENDSDLANRTNLTADFLNFVLTSTYFNTTDRFMNNKTEKLWEALFPRS